VSEDQLHEILSEVDANKNAQVDLGEFLQVALLANTQPFNAPLSGTTWVGQF